VSDTLNQLLCEIETERIEKHDGSESHIPIEVVKAEKIDAFLTDLQRNSESFIIQYFTGLFLSSKDTEPGYKCPSIRLLSLQSIAFKSAENLIAWVKEQSHFIDIVSAPP
jgi:hypothetical protein